MFYTLARKGRAELQAFSQTSQKEERRFEAFDSGSFSTHNRLARLGKPHDNMTKASRPSMKTPSTAGMRNYLLAPDVPQCPWSFQKKKLQEDYRNLPDFLFECFSCLLHQDTEMADSLNDLAKTLPSIPLVPAPSPYLSAHVLQEITGFQGGCRFPGSQR